MIEAQSNETEQILWSLLRAHQQRAEFARRMAKKEEGSNRHELAARLRERAAESQADADLVERIIRDRHNGNSGASGRKAAIDEQ
jgi:two-component system chemotaxis response regulator CheB